MISFCETQYTPFRLLLWNSAFGDDCFLCVQLSMENIGARIYVKNIPLVALHS